MIFNYTFMDKFSKLPRPGMTLIFLIAFLLPVFDIMIVSTELPPLIRWLLLIGISLSVGYSAQRGGRSLWLVYPTGLFLGYCFVMPLFLQAALAALRLFKPHSFDANALLLFLGVWYSIVALTLSVGVGRYLRRRKDVSGAPTDAA